MCQNFSIDFDLSGAELSSAQDDAMFKIYFWFDGVISTTFAMIGLVMNSVTIFILTTNKDMKNMFNYLLSSVLIANNVFLLTKILNAFYWDFKLKSLMWVIPYLVYPIEKTSLAASIFLTISLAHQRWVLTWNPTMYKRLSHTRQSSSKRILYYILPAIIFALLFNIPKWFSYSIIKVKDEDGDEIEYKIVKTTLKTNFHFVVLYENLFSMVITAFAPITLLVFFNWNVYRFIHQKQTEIEENMRLIEESEFKSSPGRSSGSSTTFTFESTQHKGQKQSEDQQRTSFLGSLKRQREKDKVPYQSQPSYAAERQRRKKKIKRNKNQTKILFIIIILFIFCHSLRCLHEFYDGLYESFTVKVMQSISRFLLIVHSSANPFIYIMKNLLFRKHLVSFIINVVFCQGLCKSKPQLLPRRSLSNQNRSSTT